MAKKKKLNVNMWELARKVGLDSILCSKCGERVKGEQNLEAFFQKIIEECKKGNRVKLKNFGAFEAKVLKGRTVKSPLWEGGEAVMDDLLVLRFSVTAKAKRALNDRPEPKRRGDKEDE